MKSALILYNIIFVPLLYIAFRLSGLFNKKISRGIKGRAHLFSQLKAQLKNDSQTDVSFLIHAASMGEYEQARPVVKLIKKKIPNACIILSLFSPSVYENIKNNSDVDITTYLPFDSPFAVRKFLNLLSPDFLLITRHDIWPNLLWQAHRRGIVSMLIDASVHEGSLRHKPVMRHFNRLLFACFDHVCIISETAHSGMKKFLNRSQKITITGDTRFDQVVARATETPVEELLPASFLSHERIFIAGSTWPEDEEIIIHAYQKAKQQVAALKLIFAPHELTDDHIDGALKKCASAGINCVKMSNFIPSNSGVDALLIDKMGILANIYCAGQVAYVGGSFGPGVHSVIEAAAHKIPVTFGPRMRNSAEAIEMVDSQCGFIIKNGDELSEYLVSWFNNTEQLEKLSHSAEKFVSSRAGASQKIVDLILEELAGS
ncbi:MAG: hypothetical protein DWQ05_01230 [Calditrichaeota bacterium]|nr:MAG: hypothetical protein DWQ05_01230 [Calditrichota bacterium]